MSRRAVLAIIAAAVLILGHLPTVLTVAAVVITLALGALAFGIAIVVAESGWRTIPVRRRFAW